MSDTGLEGSAGVETRSSEGGCFSVSDTEAESNLSDCFGLSHEEGAGFLSWSLEASFDMRGSGEGANKRRKRDGWQKASELVFLSCLHRANLSV